MFCTKCGNLIMFGGPPCCDAYARSRNTPYEQETTVPTIDADRAPRVAVPMTADANCPDCDGTGRRLDYRIETRDGSTIRGLCHCVRAQNGDG